MKRISFLICAAGLLFHVAVNAEPTRFVTLTDGSTLQAEVLSLSDGVYQLRTDSLGILLLPESKIQSISANAPNNEAPPVSAPAENHTAEIREIQKSLVADPNSMSQIEALKNDPAMQNILSDETTMRAIQSGDLNSLMNDPKIKALMENPAIKELTGTTP